MYRLSSAREKLESARILLEAGQFKDSIGRSYYAIFSAVRAVIAKDNVDFSKHSGVIAYFQKEYIKTGRIEVKYSKYLQTAFQIRNNCDYDDFFIVSQTDATEQFQHASEMIAMIENFLKVHVD